MKKQSKLPKMNIEELKKFFNRYNIYTLDSIHIMLNIIEENEPNEINQAYNSVYQKKYEEMKDEFEGRNEYDYITMLRNFDITEICNNLDELSERELGFIVSLVKETVYKLTSDQLESPIEDHLLEFVRAYEKEFIRRLKPTIDTLTEKEIKSFFKKYSVVELEAFDNILDYSCDYNTRDIRRIKHEVYEEKYRELQSNFEVGIRPRSFKLSDISKKNKKLSDTELNFLHLLVESSASYLDSIQEFEDNYKEIFEDFDSGDYPIKEMSILLDSIEKEKDNRLNSIKTNKKTI